MKATAWEFKYRALIFGLIFGLSFPLYSVDHQNSAAALANWVGARLRMDALVVAHALFALAALLIAAAALIRTWASAYLAAGVVYAAEVKTESLIADGPYRRVRNPLYFANVLLAIGMGALMSRAGFLLAVTAMVVFCYRLIFREEAGLETSQGEQYQRYLDAVPRIWPSLSPRAATAGRQASWALGFKSEFWCWGLAAAVAVFAITLSTVLFFVMLGVSLVLFWVSMAVLQKKPDSEGSGPRES